MSDALAELQSTPGVTPLARPSADLVPGPSIEEALPPAHREFLARGGPCVAYWGYFRLFGCTLPSILNLEEWNRPSTWKFAWSTDVCDFLCFGETAWGDQYAYKYTELADDSPSVHFLDSITMRSEIIAPSFEAFLMQEFLRNARRPYDTMIEAARRKFGDLPLARHLIYSPSLLLGGREELDGVQVVDAVAGMVINGDLASQLAGAPPSATVKELQRYFDETGRPRLRVVFG